MSYGLRIAADAMADLRMLEPWLQEEALDELEGLLERASAIRVDAQGEFAHDFERARSGQRHVIFLRLQRDENRGVLTLLAAGSYSRAERTG